MTDIRMYVDVIHYAVERLGFTEIKSLLQLEVVLAIATGQDIFGVLPTGYGKSRCYACLPDQLHKSNTRLLLWYLLLPQQLKTRYGN